MVREFQRFLLWGLEQLHSLTPHPKMCPCILWLLLLLMGQDLNSKNLFFITSDSLHEFISLHHELCLKCWHGNEPEVETNGCSEACFPSTEVESILPSVTVLSLCTGSCFIPCLGTRPHTECVVVVSWVVRDRLTSLRTEYFLLMFTAIFSF